jgi:hypothetical protein
MGFASDIRDVCMRHKSGAMMRVEEQAEKLRGGAMVLILIVTSYSFG